MHLIDRYILRAVATPLILALMVAGMLLLLEHMLRLFDFVLAEQGPVDVVWRMLANLVPHYFGLALPLGTFLGVMLAFRNFSMSSELDALSSSGASFGRLMRPIYVLIAFIMVLDFLLVSYVQPFARYEYQQIRFDVTSGALGIKIPAGEFIDISDRVTIRLGEINPETRDAREIFLERRSLDGGKTIITARYGAISTTPEISSLLLKLTDGRQVILNPLGDRIQTLNFETFDLEVDLPAIGVFRERGGDEREATITEIVRLLASESPQSSPLFYEYRAGLHWRILHPLTFLVLPILAVAMGVTGRRRASNLKPVIGIAILIVYHELLEEWGKVVAQDGILSPWISMWGIFAVFIMLSLSLYVGSIDKARTTKVMARRSQDTVRIAAPATDIAE
ncbi:LptF/LptG family permease [Hyphococcus flavus]|uniref:LptF/LptG family permease n=1 Tax=Hyphococcus flavus TaxID=1866326 RepID=A0AAE9ZHG3_9PROT|nr:LptF/LptG family permease [Hyphococcus flavus]WDI32882.1 LptF/LptG family permease [Hyphococcus flavus]